LKLCVTVFRRASNGRIVPPPKCLFPECPAVRVVTRVVMVHLVLPPASGAKTRSLMFRSQDTRRVVVICAFRH